MSVSKGANKRPIKEKGKWLGAIITAMLLVKAVIDWLSQKNSSSKTVSK